MGNQPTWTIYFNSRPQSTSVLFQRMPNRQKLIQKVYPFIALQATVKLL